MFLPPGPSFQDSGVRRRRPARRRVRARRLRQDAQGRYLLRLPTDPGGSGHGDRGRPGPGMIEGNYRVGGEVHAWMWMGGLGADFEKELLASFADINSDTGENNASPETSAIKRAVEEK